MAKRNPRLDALNKTIRQSTRELKSRTRVMVKSLEADDPFRGLGDFELTRATIVRGITRLAGVTITKKYTEPKPKRTPVKKTAKKKPVAKQPKRKVQPAATVVVKSPNGHEHVLEVDPGLSDLLSDGWVIVEGAI